MIYSLLYVIIFSFGIILIQSLYSSVSPIFSLLVTSIIATLYFNILNIGKLKVMYASCFQQKQLWLSIMITILIMWGAAMISPGIIGASLYSFLSFSWTGMLGFIFLGLDRSKRERAKLYLGIGVLALIVYTVCNSLWQTPSWKQALGIILALLVGSSVFVYFKQSQAIAKVINLAASQILAVRFYLTITVLLIILPKHSIASYLTGIEFLKLFLLAFFTLIIPLYCQQKALEKISAEQNAIIVSLTPILTSILQAIFFKKISISQDVIYLLYTFIIISSYLISQYNSRYFLKPQATKQ